MSWPTYKDLIEVRMKLAVKEALQDLGIRIADIDIAMAISLGLLKFLYPMRQPTATDIKELYDTWRSIFQRLQAPVLTRRESNWKIKSFKEKREHE